MKPLLLTDGLTVSYGGVVAVNEVTLEVRRGELVGLIGPNGAGKTTTIDAICGFVPHRGRVVVDGRNVSAEAPHVRARAGLSRTWQSVELFEDLTVRQNCQVAEQPIGPRRLIADLVPRRRSRPGGHDVVASALAALGLTDDADRTPALLSHGRRKLAGVARALAATPRVLLLDEPAAGLDTEESRRLGTVLRSIVIERDIGGLLIDHDTSMVFDVCDRVIVLDFGTVIANGTPSEVRGDPSVLAAYLGVVDSTESSPE